MASDLSNERMLELRIIFDKFDFLKNGTISTSNLKSIFQQMGQAPTKDELNKLITKFDEYNKGFITFSVFLKIIINYYKEKPIEEELKISFDNFKDSQSDFITLTKIKNTLLNSGYEIDENELDQMLMEVDIDEKGALNKDEFIKLITKDIDPYIEFSIDSKNTFKK